ncbi:MAG TPA: hydroxysqualene dehydroxylase HpnE [Casimicrobiaceae bacterium]
MTRAALAVIGGGWAGCAAAVTLAESGFAVDLVEAAPELGGRARRVARHGLCLDNGQHLMLGAYRETLDLMARIDAPALARRPLRIAPFAPAQRNALALTARRLPAPLGLLAGLLRAQGLDWRERIATLRWFAALRARTFRCDPAATVAQLTAPLPRRAAERLWHPLCLAALNTHPAEASAQIFANVLHAAFAAVAGGADWMAPAGDLGTLVPDATRRFLAAGGHRVVAATTAQVVEARASPPTGWRVRVGDTARDYAGVVVAVAPHQLAHAFAPPVAAREPALAAALALVEGLRWEPITTVYLGYATTVAVETALVRLDDQPGQWLFARDDIVATARPPAPRLASVVAVAISAHGAHDALAHDALAAAVDAQLRRLAPRWPALAWSQVIEEKRATYACTPQATRPRAGVLMPGIALAGDYTDDRFPATLEAAVRSGNRAAAALARALRAGDN